MPAAALATDAPAVAESGVIPWTPATVAATLGIFLFAGLAEIGGGWLVWQGMRKGRPWWWIVGGVAVLACYGFIPTLQPPAASFGRVYAVYGGVFIALSYAWGAVLDGDRPDAGDWAGGAVALAGVVLAWFWPRR
ncbi:hypothetical protein Rsub_01036 [Raphidocelis subcapitata]|uniref:Uncharacterized protein n=1 Tax=Raphidocelis subcapitata TaxID=307507 RepID=A0A2V0NLL9_9CHLO|nr:hypothetical protein Rsub_01036 [Raphidocelis subcapitata]|eukprot:GBF88324.1 hypothetical protein Rsub_01036 [Raphidocelis subcapitata]